MKQIFAIILSALIVFVAWLAFLVASSNSAHADDLYSYASLEKSARVGSFSASLGEKVSDSMAIQADFIDEGKQPDSIKNINRIVNLDLVQQFKIGSFYLSPKAGLTSSYFSHNGSGNGYDNHTGFNGQNIGLAAGYDISKSISVEFSDSAARYLQSDHHAYETFNFLSVGLNVKF
jgi:hypothetical protein